MNIVNKMMRINPEGISPAAFEMAEWHEAEAQRLLALLKKGVAEQPKSEASLAATLEELHEANQAASASDETPQSAFEVADDAFTQAAIDREQTPPEVARCRAKVNVGVGMPANMYLVQFGSVVWDAFGWPPYHVGSSLVGKQWRDVDVRLMLEDKEYDAMFGTDPNGHGSNNCKWVALCMAFSALGKQMTGLPIDFQIQRQSDANRENSGPRSALGITPMRQRMGQLRSELNDK